MKPSDHPVFREFAPWRGHVDAGFAVNFVGQKTDVEFLRGFGWATPQRMVNRHEVTDYGPDYLSQGEEWFEWLIALEAILEARGAFTMVELGAGFGRWLVGAACAARTRRHDLKLRLIGVEAQADHFRWMDKHLRDNDLDPADHKLIEGAVALTSGSTFLLDGPDPTGFWGQHMTNNPSETNSAIAGSFARPVRTVTLQEVLQGEGRIDLVDMDIQDAEREIVPGNIELLTRHVRRVHVETHSTDTHAICDSALRSAGWHVRHSFPPNERADTEFGPVNVPGGGVLTAVNPRLQSFARRLAKALRLERALA
jgi:FkbM family methyltransferase